MPWTYGSPRKFTALLNLATQVSKVLSQPAMALNVSPAAMPLGIGSAAEVLTAGGIVHRAAEGVAGEVRLAAPIAEHGAAGWRVKLDNVLAEFLRQPAHLGDELEKSMVELGQWQTRRLASCAQPMPVGVKQPAP